MRDHFVVVTKEGTYLFAQKVVPENTEKWTSHAMNSNLFVTFFLRVTKIVYGK